MGEYHNKYYHGDALAFQKIYFEHLAMAAESKHFDAISHPDLVKNCFPRKWELAKVIDHICVCLDRIAKTGVAMELNTAGLRKNCREIYPSPKIVHLAAQAGVPITFASDAHAIGEVGMNFAEAVTLARGAGYTHCCRFAQRRRQETKF